uniref:Uncharacterized protein n=1 Tax=Arundo donax TaxID=35708 RepID=A0A0A9EG38_ARUDO
MLLCLTLSSGLLSHFYM